jgi:P27 family predicted phage terminase small subunit
LDLIFMVGPKPKPVEQKRALGNPGQRRLPDLRHVVSMASAHLEPPLECGPAGAQVWSKVLSECRWVGQSDLLALQDLCVLVDERHVMREKVNVEGLVLVSHTGSFQAHPLLSHIRDLTKQIHALFASMGLTPSDRGRIGLGEVQAQSKIEQLAAKRKAQ